MKTPAIPHGWRKLKKGTTINGGDKYYSIAAACWETTTSHGFIVGSSCCVTPSTGKPLLYIRRKHKSPSAKEGSANWRFNTESGPRILNNTENLPTAR